MKKRIIAFTLIVTILGVCVIGENYTNNENRGNVSAAATETSANAENVSRLKKTEELNLAETDTDSGKISETLQAGYEKLAQAYECGENVESAAEEFSALVSELRGQTVEELRKTDNGTEEFQKYETTVLSGYDELAGFIQEYDDKNAKNILSKIREKVAPEKEYVSLADDLPFANVESDGISVEPYTYMENEAYEPENNQYSESDLETTNDTIINDKIISEFEKLESPLEIYQYVKNQYMPEFYYGSRKGAIGTYEQKAGNDYDIASLLIGILRNRNIPARYVQGKIEITAQQAMEWTAADDIYVALRIISSLGIPATGMTSNGEVTAVRLEHVWVEAYVPYTDYRGAGNQSGENLWIPLDPSFKKIEYVDGVELCSVSDYVYNENNYITADTEMNGVNVGELVSVVEGQDSAFVKYMLENGYGEATLTEAFGGRTIEKEDLGYLPLTLPYSVNDIINKFDDIPEELTESITFSLGGNSAFNLDFGGSDSIKEKLYTPDIYGKRIVLAYTAASENDKEILDKYGDIFKTPVYLLKLKPQLIINGEVIAEGLTCNAGYMQKYKIGIHSAVPGREDETVQNSIVAGGMYCVALDYGTISADSLQSSAEYMETLKKTASEQNIYTDEVMGEMLNSVAKAYFAQLDLYNLIAAGQHHVTAARDFSVGIVGFQANVLYTFALPTEMNEGGIFLDIGHDVHSVISNDNNDKNEKAYMLQSGIYASAMEHGVLEQITGVESVSTIKVLEYAQTNNIPIHTISKENISDEIEILKVSEQVKKEIRSSVNAGKLVIIPEKEVKINQWFGTGYMVLDPDTCACGYMISGGLAGGAMTSGQMILEYLIYVAVGAFYIVLWEVATAAILAMAPCGWVVCYQLLINYTQALLLIRTVIQMVDLLIQYAKTGNKFFLQEFAVQTAACVTLGIATKLFRNKINELKDKVAKTVKDASLGGTCFIAGTLVFTAIGLVPIETVAAGEMVWSFNPQTQEVSQKQVEEMFVRKSAELVHVKLGDEIITATPEHPFYAAKKGFVNAVDLRAGDRLCTVNQEYVIVEWVQHEILETPVEVYNFRVADNHTYFVGENKVGVHNASYGGTEKPDSPESYLGEALKQQNLNEVPNELKQSWTDGNYKYEVRVHDGDVRYTDAETIYRVSRQKIPSSDPKVQGTGKEYLGSDGNWYHTSVLKPNSTTYNELAARITHIPLKK